VGAVSETIASRCRTVLLGLTDTDTIVASLQEHGVEVETANNLAALSYGAIGWAKAAAQDPDLATRRLELRDNLKTWSSMSLVERLFAAETLVNVSSRSDKKRELIIEELEMLMTWWRDVMLVMSGNTDLIVNSGSREEIEGLAAGVTPAQAQGVLRAIAVAGARIDQNVDPRLTLESLAVSLPAGPG